MDQMLVEMTFDQTGVSLSDTFSLFLYCGIDFASAIWIPKYESLQAICLSHTPVS